MPFATAALTAAGLPAGPAEAVVRGRVEPDLLGHTRRGLALPDDNIEELAEMCGRVRSAGGRLLGPWSMDRHGPATDDPSVTRQGGTILPIGGQDHGHKGDGLSLLAQAVTQGLGRFGRADAPTEWGASALVLALSPALFRGLDGFARQTGWAG